MRLLFDENLSPRLPALLVDEYPESVHVRDVGLASASDDEVWTYAANNRFTIVSKDSDFHQRSLLHGFPPKVIWLRRGNCSTDQIAGLLRVHALDIERFHASDEGSFLEIE